MAPRARLGARRRVQVTLQALQVAISFQNCAPLPFRRHHASFPGVTVCKALRMSVDVLHANCHTNLISCSRAYLFLRDAVDFSHFGSWRNRYPRLPDRIAARATATSRKASSFSRSKRLLGPEMEMPPGTSPPFSKTGTAMQRMSSANSRSS